MNEIMQEEGLSERKVLAFLPGCDNEVRQRLKIVSRHLYGQTHDHYLKAVNYALGCREHIDENAVPLNFVTLNLDELHGHDWARGLVIPKIKSKESSKNWISEYEFLLLAAMLEAAMFFRTRYMGSDQWLDSLEEFMAIHNKFVLLVSWHGYVDQEYTEEIARKTCELSPNFWKK